MPPDDDRRAAINGDHNPSEFAICPGCLQATYPVVIPTSAGAAIVYVCDACDRDGPRLYIPHIERFERGVQYRKNLSGAQRIVNPVRKPGPEPN